MIHDRNNYQDLEAFILSLKEKEEVIGIVEYGGRCYENMKLGGDYDLTVILREPLFENFNGLHFHIGGIPVDCMLISLADFTQEYPQNEFMLVHLNCKILFDRDGSVKRTLDRIKGDWSLPKELSEVQVSLYRFTFKHILDKLQNRLHHNELFTNYFIYASFEWYLNCYSRINKLEVGKPKVHLEYIKNNNEELFNVINKMYEASDIDTRFKMLKRCAEIMIEPIGGLWKDDEVIFHMISEDHKLESEQERALELLFR